MPRTIFRLFAPVAITLFLVVAPIHAYAADATFFGPLVPTECKCPGGAPGYGCILETIQRAINLGVTLGVIAATIALVFAGATWMTASGNPEARSKGRDMLINVFIGLFILLSAWLVVDFIMKRLYDSKEYGPWHSILKTDAANLCINQTTPTKIPGFLGSGATAELGGTGNQVKPPLTAGGKFTWDSGIQAQMAQASPQLVTLLNCMGPKMPSGVGRISSISDSQVSSGAKTMQQCAAGGCAHTAGSCHYGGKTCVGQSYAVDFGDQEHASTIKPIALSCGADFTLFEATNFHVSVGKSCGCN
ncbi:MAG: pilin [Bacillota bacterium]